MRTGIALGAGLLLLLLALAVEAPATLIDGRLAANSGGRLRLADARGTAWNGDGDLRLLPGDTRLPIRWRIAMWPLLWGEWRGSVGSDDVQPSASFEISHGDYTLRNLALALPADALLRAAGAPAALGPAGGTLSIRSDALTQRGEGIDGRIDLRWDNASLPGPRPDLRIALGDVRIDASGHAAELAGTLSNRGGDVDIGGTAALTTNGIARIDAVIRPRPGIEAERSKAIVGVLSALGQPDGAGGYRVAWSQAMR